MIQRYTFLPACQSQRTSRERSNPISPSLSGLISSLIYVQSTHGYIKTISSKNAVPVDFDAYQEWRRHHRSSSSPSTQSVDNNNPIITRPSDDHSPTPISTQKESASSPPQYSPTKIKETSITPIASPSASASAEPPSTEPPAASAPAPAEEARYPTSFNHIVELIINGQPIPGIKDVPDTVLSGQDSPAATAKRKKPWEA